MAHTLSQFLLTVFFVFGVSLGPATASEINPPDQRDSVPGNTVTRLEKADGLLPDAIFPSGPMEGGHGAWNPFTDTTKGFGLDLGLAYSVLGQRASRAQVILTFSVDGSL